MDFLIFYKLLKSNRSSWLEAVFYLSISLLIALIVSYGIFILEISSQKKAIDKQTILLDQIGTGEQKNQEKIVVSYVQKMNDFSVLLEGHRFSSNALKLVQDKTMPYIWFNQFFLDEKANTIQLFGEADNVENLSRQVMNLEQSEYVQKINLLNSKIGIFGKVVFNLNIVLNPSMFNYIADQTKKDQDKNIQSIDHGN